MHRAYWCCSWYCLSRSNLMLNFSFITDVILHHLSLFYGSSWSSFKVCLCLAYNHQSDRPSLWSFCQTTGDRLRCIPPTDQKPSSDKPSTCTSRRKPVLHCMSELIFRVIFHLLIWQVSTSLSVLLSVILSFSPFTLKSESTYSSLCLEDSHFNIRNPFSPTLRVLVAH